MGYLLEGLRAGDGEMLGNLGLCCLRMLPSLLRKMWAPRVSTDPGYPLPVDLLGELGASPEAFCQAWTFLFLERLEAMAWDATNAGVPGQLACA